MFQVGQVRHLNLRKANGPWSPPLVRLLDVIPDRVELLLRIPIQLRTLRLSFLAIAWHFAPRRDGGVGLLRRLHPQSGRLHVDVLQ